MNAPAVANPQIEKQCFRNDSPGWIGVTIIDAKGQDQGRSVEPGGLVWLSESEQILTANAPREAKDNPFIEQDLTFGVDEEGNPVTRRVTPLLPVTENRFVPAGDRPIPAQGMQAAPITEPAPMPEPESEEEAPDPEAVAARERAVLDAQAAGQRPGPTPVPPRAAAAVEAANEAKVAAQPTPPVEEEHAAVTPPPAHTEETGAAAQPSQDAVEGEYAAQEEVGTPTAPAAAPAPYTPPEEG